MGLSIKRNWQGKVKCRVELDVTESKSYNWLPIGLTVFLSRPAKNFQ